MFELMMLDCIYSIQLESVKIHMVIPHEILIPVGAYLSCFRLADIVNASITFKWF